MLTCKDMLEWLSGFAPETPVGCIPIDKKNGLYFGVENVVFIENLDTPVIFVEMGVSAPLNELGDWEADDGEAD